MRKKELKRLLKLYKSDNGALADESIFYEARAEKAEVFIERLVKAVYPDKWYRLHRREDQPKILVWYETLRSIAEKWDFSEPKSYREASDG